jgi:N6-L-threonylcarbamoyladenine synthase
MDGPATTHLADPLSPQQKADVAACVQAAIVEVLVKKSLSAIQTTGLRRLVVAGGVGANALLREQLNAACAKARIRVHYPELHWCTDNGAMIALAAGMRVQAGLAPLDAAPPASSYRFDVRPRWPLADL